MSCQRQDKGIRRQGPEGRDTFCGRARLSIRVDLRRRERWLLPFPLPARPACPDFGN